MASASFPAAWKQLCKNKKITAATSYRAFCDSAAAIRSAAGPARSDFVVASRSSACSFHSVSFHSEATVPTPHQRVLQKLRRSLELAPLRFELAKRVNHRTSESKTLMPALSSAFQPQTAAPRGLTALAVRRLGVVEQLRHQSHTVGHRSSRSATQREYAIQHGTSSGMQEI